ncbi:MAG: proton-conducting transporter membrane subunit, partial [Pseudomonadota bacterium]
MTPDYAGLFSALLPEASLVLGAVLVLGLDLTRYRHRRPSERLSLALWVGLLALVAAGFQVWHAEPGPVFGGELLIDHLATATRLGVVALTLLTFGITQVSPAPRQSAEYVAILLLAASGLLVMAAAQQLLLVFLALELASLSLYVLAGFDRTRAESAEAGLKYFLFGGMAAAFLLFGFSLVYGATGSIELPEIARQIAAQGSNPLLVVGLMMILVAFGFKVAAAPFHLWAPDVYQGAPAPSAALIASASKLAGFTLFTRLLWPGFSPAAGSVTWLNHSPGWFRAVAVLAGASLVLGNVAALAQTSLRRLLAYSAIAHAGALL